MIICTHARTGATKYALDKAEELDLPCYGELSPAYLQGFGKGPGIKAIIHETKFQPVLSSEEFTSCIEKHDDKVLLVNKSGYLLGPIADVIILRKDLLASLLSFCNLLSRLNSSTPETILFYTTLVFQDCLGMITYCYGTEQQLNLKWFEDLYPKHEQNLESIDSKLLPVYTRFLSELVGGSDAMEKIECLTKLY